MSLHNPTGACVIGVLDFKKDTDQFIPVVERARGPGRSIEALDDLRALIMGIAEGDRRTEALNQFERVEVAVQGNRWHRSAAGHILEATCVDDPERVRDLIPVLTSCSGYLYDWNEDYAEAIYTFFGFLSDRTLPWASPSDTWRAIVPPNELEGPAEAFGAMNPRDLRKMLAEAESGDVFSEEEAREIGAWWETVRKALRVALRSERGFYISVHHDE